MKIITQGEIGVNAGSVVLDTEDVIVYRFDTKAKYAWVHTFIEDGAVSFYFGATDRTLYKNLGSEEMTVVEARDPRFTTDSDFRCVTESGRYTHDVIFYRVKHDEDQVWTYFEETP
ncbi:MAG: hypothetical protein LAT68_15805 [Cyclobacteriaceae bacterium]|nr:hypothetical protein [Cyclobacteriaceae bacterium]